MDTAPSWQERLDALQCLITAPFVITLIVGAVVAISFTAYIERSTRR